MVVGNRYYNRAYYCFRSSPIFVYVELIQYSAHLEEEDIGGHDYGTFD